MWNSTDLMARSIAEGIAATDCRAQLLPLSGNHRSDIAAAALTAGALVIGSPTLNGGILPAMADTLTYLKGLKHRNLVTGGVFGSYGWSGESLKILEAQLACSSWPPNSLDGRFSGYLFCFIARSTSKPKSFLPNVDGFK